MQAASLDGLSLSDLAWTYKWVPSKHRETSIWHARPFSSICSARTIKVELQHMGNWNSRDQCPAYHQIKQCEWSQMKKVPIYLHYDELRLFRT